MHTIDKKVVRDVFVHFSCITLQENKDKLTGRYTNRKEVIFKDDLEAIFERGHLIKTLKKQYLK
jgi:hypothetical protein